MSLLGHDYASASYDLSRTVPSAALRARRLRLLRIGAGCWVLLVIARLVSLQITNATPWRSWAAKQHGTQMTLAAERGPVLDREGRFLAVSLPASSLYVRPRQVRDGTKTSEILARELGLSPKSLAAKLRSEKPFVWIQRQLPRSLAERVMAQKLPGLGVVSESRRVYPYNHAASSLIGKVGVDGGGLSGVELAFDRQLQRDAVKVLVGRDALGQVITTGAGEDLALPKGDAVKLTIDAALQVIVEEELEAGRAAAKAAHGLALMIDSDTGEILSLAQAPSIDFNQSSLRSKQQLKNLVLETVFEPGSILKPIVAAAAIDAGVVRASDVIDCENGRFPFASHVIKDVHPSQAISFFDVVVRSSNIGMTKVGMRMGRDRLYHSLLDFGFGTPSGLRFRGESSGILRNVSGWAKVDVATHSFGQGIAVTPIQVVRSIAAIANGGTVPNIHVVASDRAEPGAARRVISERTSSIVREMMYGVVEDKHGTGAKAAVSGVRIGGKTGTAQKARADGRGYAAGKYLASFVGFADARSVGVPKNITLMVAIDEPDGDSIYGGTLAAPVFQRIMQRSLHHLMTSEAFSGQNRPSYREPQPSQRSQRAEVVPVSW